MTDLNDYKVNKFYSNLFKDIQEYFDFLKYFKQAKPNTEPPSYAMFYHAQKTEFAQRLNE